MEDDGMYIQATAIVISEVKRNIEEIHRPTVEETIHQLGLMVSTWGTLHEDNIDKLKADKKFLEKMLELRDALEERLSLDKEE